MSLFLYHLRLAARSLRRDPVVTIIMLAALTLADGIWSVAVSQYVRFEGHGIELPPTLHQVEVLRAPDANAAFAEGAAANPYFEATDILSRTHVSYPENQRLAASRIPARRSASIRSQVIVRRHNMPASVRMARFTDVDFFSMFRRRFAVGGPWERALDGGEPSGVTPARPTADAAPVPVVLGFALGHALFPQGGALGQTIVVEGRRFRVAGVLAHHQPLNAPWHLMMFGGNEDALFLPMRQFNRLSARPDQPIYRSPVGADRAALLASDTLFVTAWVDLPTPQHEEEYRRDLDRMFGSGRTVLRSLSEWRQRFPMPRSQIAFFGFLGLIVLVGGAFNLARWLLTRGLSRSAELGVFRALGAPRSSLFGRIMAEATLLALPAALLAPVAAMPFVWLFNKYVRLVDMPLEVGRLALLISIIPSFLVGVLGGLYPAWRLARTPPTLYLGGL
jgi:putative ABC transport system permease protein